VRKTLDLEANSAAVPFYATMCTYAVSHSKKGRGPRESIRPELEKPPACNYQIRDEIRHRFTWDTNLELFVSRLESLKHAPGSA